MRLIYNELGVLIIQTMENKEAVENKEETTVFARQNGPIIINGAFTFDDGEGNITKQTRLSICRCAVSNKMPYCDGSHNRVNFQS